MNVALVKDPQHDIHRDNRRENQKRFVRERCTKRLRRALKTRLDGDWHSDLFFCFFDRRDRVTERISGGKVERKCYDRKLALMIDCQRSLARFEVRDSA